MMNSWYFAAHLANQNMFEDGKCNSVKSAQCANRQTRQEQTAN